MATTPRVAGAPAPLSRIETIWLDTASLVVAVVTNSNPVVLLNPIPRAPIVVAAIPLLPPGKAILYAKSYVPLPFCVNFKTPPKLALSSATYRFVPTNTKSYGLHPPRVVVGFVEMMSTGADAERGEDQMDVAVVVLELE